MKVLKHNRRQLIIVNLLSRDENDGTTIRILKYLGIFLVSSILFYSAQVSSLMFCYHNPTDMIGISNSLITNIGGLSAYGAYLGFIANIHNIDQLHRELQKIVDNGIQY